MASALEYHKACNAVSTANSIIKHQHPKQVSQEPIAEKCLTLAITLVFVTAALRRKATPQDRFGLSTGCSQKTPNSTLVMANQCLPRRIYHFIC